MRFVITLLVPDRVGILRDMTGAVTDLGGNIDGISQTVVAGYFTVTLTATFDAAMNQERLHARIADKFRDAGSVIGVLPYSASSTPPAASGERYIVTITGPDAPGELKSMTAFFAARNVNINDWYVTFAGTRVTHVGEVSVPHTLDIAHLQAEFAETMTRFGMSGRIQHENIFRATNEVGPIKALLSEPHHAAHR